MLFLIRALAVALTFSACLRAEPPKRFEAVGHVGSLKYGGDEGYEDDSIAGGFTATVPFHRRWAVEVDGAFGEREHFDSQGLGANTRRMILGFHVVYRRGSERIYWFGGGGPGYQRDSSRGRTQFQNPFKTAPTIVDFKGVDNRFSPLGYKTGVVVNPTSRLIVRGEVLFQHAYVLPNVMVRVGVGFRF